MKIRTLLSASLIVATLSGCGLQAAPPLALARDAGTLLEINLRSTPAYPAAKGKAKFKNRGGEREFQVEVENVRALSGRVLGVFVAGSRVGGARVNRLGEGRLELNSDRGQQVPTIRSGTPVRVKTPSGILVVTGSF